MNFSLPAASANAPEVDHLMLALLADFGAVLALVFGLMLLYIVNIALAAASTAARRRKRPGALRLAGPSRRWLLLRAVRLGRRPVCAHRSSRRRTR